MAAAWRQRAVADRWLEGTNRPIIEGYGPGRR
jgi:hypothetical protein